MPLPGGILEDDWQTPNQHKLDIIAKAHPAPTRFPQWQVVPAAPSPEQCQVQATFEPAAAACDPATLPVALADAHASACVTAATADAAAAPSTSPGAVPPGAAEHPDLLLTCGTVEVSSLSAFVGTWCRWHVLLSHPAMRPCGVLNLQPAVVVSDDLEMS